MAEDLEKYYQDLYEREKEKTNSLPTAFQPARGKWRI